MLNLLQHPLWKPDSPSRKWALKQVQDDDRAGHGRQTELRATRESETPMIPPVRPILLGDVEAAWQNVADTVLRTPLIRLELGTGAPEIYLKLENLQPTNAYKIRGAANA